MASDPDRIVFPNTRAGWEDEIEYNSRLYKEVLNPFKQHVDAMQLRDSPPIIRILSHQDLQHIAARHLTSGNIEAAGALLECMVRKHNWYDAFLAALDIPSLRMQEFKPRFQALRRAVTHEWQEEKMKENLQRAQGGAGRGMPRISRDAFAHTRIHPPFPVSEQMAADSSVPTSDFQVLSGPIASPEDTSEGMQVDQPEDEEEGSDGHRTPTNEDDGEGTQPKFYLEDQQPSNTAGTQPPASNIIVLEGNREPTIYSGLEPSTQQQSTYERLPSNSGQRKSGGPNSLEVDAVIEWTQEEEASMEVSSSQHNTTGQAQSAQREQEALQASERRRITTRRDHPSLSNSITDSPKKDFEGAFVEGELCRVAGWVNIKEELEVMELLKSRLAENGHYVIWFWELAKRPTICVTHNRKLLTFVVHKSASRDLYNCNFYINRQQKKVRSLKELIVFHLSSGINHKFPTGREDTIWLRTPVT